MIPEVTPHPVYPYDDPHWGICRESCQYCGCTPVHIPNLTITADRRCEFCAAEWDALQALGFTRPTMLKRWERGANARIADRRQRISAAQADRQAKGVAA